MSSKQEKTAADAVPSSKKGKSGEFGGKRIGFPGSFCLNINNSMGPAMVVLPLLNQSAGWLTPTLSIILFFVLSNFAATMLCEAMQRIPGNRNFDATPRYEFATTVRHYYGTVAYGLFQFFYIVSLQALNIVGMIISAQMIDILIYSISKHSYALDYSKFKILQACADYNDTTTCFENDNIFSSNQILTIGFIICMIICIPFGYLNLDANMWFQWLSLFGLFFFTAEFVVQFILNTIPSTPWYKNGTDDFSSNGPSLVPLFNLTGQPQLLGLSILAYAYIVTIPSWVNEKKRRVSVNKSVWYPAMAACTMKLGVGLSGSMAFQLFNQTSQTMMPGADNILGCVLSPDMPWWTRYSGFLWVFTTIIPGIPVMAIMVRYNLQAGGLGKKMSFFLGVVAPWIVTLFCYEYNALTEICSWVGNIASGFVNFTIPAFLFYSARKRYPFLDGEERRPVKDNKEASMKTIGRPEPVTNSVPRPKLVYRDLESYLAANDRPESSASILSTPSGSRVNSRRNSVSSTAVDKTTLYPILDDFSAVGETTPLINEHPVSVAINAKIDDVSDENDSDDGKGDYESVYYEPPVNAVPSWLRVNPAALALVIGVVFTILSVGYIGVLIYAAAVGDNS